MTLTPLQIFYGERSVENAHNNLYYFGTNKVSSFLSVLLVSLIYRPNLFYYFLNKVKSIIFCFYFHVD